MLLVNLSTYSSRPPYAQWALVQWLQQNQLFLHLRPRMPLMQPVGWSLKYLLTAFQGIKWVITWQQFRYTKLLLTAASRNHRHARQLALIVTLLLLTVRIPLRLLSSTCLPESHERGSIPALWCMVSSRSRERKCSYLLLFKLKNYCFNALYSLQTTRHT